MSKHIGIRTARTLLAIAVACLSLVLCATGCTTTNSESNDYAPSANLSNTVTTGSVSMDYPEGFTATENSAGETVKQDTRHRATTGEEYQGLVVSLLNEDQSVSVLLAEYSGVTLDELYEDALAYPETVKNNQDETASKWPGTGELIDNSEWSEPEKMTLNGHDAFRYEWLANGSTAMYYLIDAGDNKVGYAAVMALGDNIAENRELYEQMLSTLRVN